MELIVRLTGTNHTPLQGPVNISMKFFTGRFVEERQGHELSPNAIPGVMDGWAFPQTIFVGKNHTFVELLSRARRCNLRTEADGVILIQRGRKICPFKIYSPLRPGRKSCKRIRPSYVLSSGISRRRPPGRNPRRGLRKRPSSMPFTDISPRNRSRSFLEPTELMELYFILNT